MDITNYSFSQIAFKECFIRKLYGISSRNTLPEFIISTEIESCEPDPLNKYNRLVGLKASHMIFVSIIRKIFLLNAHSTENELCRNYGNKEDRRIASELLKLLVKEKIISKPDECDRYLPKTFNRKRVLKIINELNNSTDSLWLDIGKIN